MDIIGISLIHILKGIIVEKVEVQIQAEEIQEQNPLTILHKKEQIVGGIKIESKVWKSICEVFSRIWTVDSFRIYV